jgi:hypothetical protein
MGASGGLAVTVMFAFAAACGGSDRGDAPPVSDPPGDPQPAPPEQPPAPPPTGEAPGGAPPVPQPDGETPGAATAGRVLWVESWGDDAEGPLAASLPDGDVALVRYLRRRATTASGETVAEDETLLTRLDRDGRARWERTLPFTEAPGLGIAASGAGLVTWGPYRPTYPEEGDPNIGFVRLDGGGSPRGGVIEVCSDCSVRLDTDEAGNVVARGLGDSGMLARTIVSAGRGGARAIADGWFAVDAALDGPGRIVVVAAPDPLTPAAHLLRYDLGGTLLEEQLLEGVSRATIAGASARGALVLLALGAGGGSWAGTALADGTRYLLVRDALGAPRWAAALEDREWTAAVVPSGQVVLAAPSSSRCGAVVQAWSLAGARLWTRSLDDPRCARPASVGATEVDVTASEHGAAIAVRFREAAAPFAPAGGHVIRLAPP